MRKRSITIHNHSYTNGTMLERPYYKDSLLNDEGINQHVPLAATIDVAQSDRGSYMDRTQTNKEIN